MGNSQLAPNRFLSFEQSPNHICDCRLTPVRVQMYKNVMNYLLFHRHVWCLLTFTGESRHSPILVFHSNILIVLWKIQTTIKSYSRNVYLRVGIYLSNVSKENASCGRNIYPCLCMHIHKKSKPPCENFIHISSLFHCKIFDAKKFTHHLKGKRLNLNSCAAG